ncbi:hypothetical protein SIO70_33205 [Chitinophaga sancti]|uniref:hypothetical protein n=1 Tax=Chitinophaga sancti TaxID=1004 RepID=UPI002A75B174|nr:hypothetical protein [Chitinophaga sancti]WPQ63230.1 hypothetical protein SIO70_33205 [Chitinophaga sancti]
MRQPDEKRLPCCRWSSIKFKNLSETGPFLIAASRTKSITPLLPLVFYKIQKTLKNRTFPHRRQPDKKHYSLAAAGHSLKMLKNYL